MCRCFYPFFFFFTVPLVPVILFHFIMYPLNCLNSFLEQDRKGSRSAQKAVLLTHFPYSCPGFPKALAFPAPASQSTHVTLRSRPGAGHCTRSSGRCGTQTSTAALETNTLLPGRCMFAGTIEMLVRPTVPVFPPPQRFEVGPQSFATLGWCHFCHAVLCAVSPQCGRFLTA